jgi:hypothetical protein
VAELANGICHGRIISTQVNPCRGGAVGPVDELRAASALDAYTAETAAQTIDYGRATARQVMADSEIAPDSEVRKAYAKMAAAQAALLAEHNLDAEAAQAYQLAIEFCPSSPEVVFRYVNLLLIQKRIQDALPLAQSAIAAAPDNQQFRDLLQQLQKAAAHPN